MGHLFDTLFSPPSIDLSLLDGLASSVRQLVTGTIKLAYHRGLFDGAVAGVLVTLLLSPSKTQVIVIKGAADVDPKK